jgi:hypothetical protein
MSSCRRREVEDRSGLVRLGGLVQPPRKERFARSIHWPARTGVRLLGYASGQTARVLDKPPPAFLTASWCAWPQSRLGHRVPDPER